MVHNENAYETKYPKVAIKPEATEKESKPLMFRCTDPAIVLDMGEASREEGFRLNGCR